MRHVPLLLMIVLLSSSLTAADQAVFTAGRRVHGTLSLDRTGALAFTPADRRTPLNLAGVTAFRLADLIADGRDAEAVRYLDWAHRTGFNVVRVLATLCCWFDLPPGAGQKALPKLLALAKERGLRVGGASRGFSFFRGQLH